MSYSFFLSSRYLSIICCSDAIVWSFTLIPCCAWFEFSQLSQNSDLTLQKSYIIWYTKEKLKISFNLFLILIFFSFAPNYFINVQVNSIYFWKSTWQFQRQSESYSSPYYWYNAPSFNKSRACSTLKIIYFINIRL